MFQILLSSEILVVHLYCVFQVQQFVKAVRNGTKDGLEKTKLAMIRKVSLLQRKDSTGTGNGTGINKFPYVQFVEIDL